MADGIHLFTDVDDFGIRKRYGLKFPVRIDDPDEGQIKRQIICQYLAAIAFCQVGLMIAGHPIRFQKNRYIGEKF